MNRIFALGAVVSVGILLASCTAVIPNDPEAVNVSSETLGQAIDAPAVSATPDALPPAPASGGGRITGVQNMQYTFDGGAIANVTLAWREAALVDPLALGCGSDVPAGRVIKAAVAEGTIEYPEVDGIVGLKDQHQLVLVAPSQDPAPNRFICSSAGSDLQYDYAMMMPLVGDARAGRNTFNLVVGDFWESTSAIPDDESTSTYKTAVMYYSSLGVDCAFDGPGITAGTNRRTKCTVHVPE